MGPNNERFEMRLDADLAARIDAWRSAQEETPSRAEAIRQLVERGMRRGSDPENVELSEGDKLIVLMLCDLLKAKDIKSDFDPAFIEDAISSGHNWALGWKYQGVFGVQVDSPAALHEVVDMLDMWDFLEESFGALSEEAKEHVRSELKYLKGDLQFIGFDGNNESEYLSIARFLVEKMDRWSRFKGRGFNSHSRVMPQYRRMIQEFLPIRTNLIGRGMTAKEIIQVVTSKYVQ